MAGRKHVLFVYTSTHTDLLEQKTGWYLPEAAHPYYAIAPSHDITFAAPAGPNPPVGPSSVELFKDDEESVRFLNDPVVKLKFAEAKKLSEVNPDEYDAIFYVGGHGPMLDLATDPTSINLVNTFYRAGKLTTGVCHGQGAFVHATGADGAPLFKGRRITSFSNVEEELVGGVKAVPFSLEDEIQAKGGSYEKASEVWGENVIVDGHVITGQNPNSARGVGVAIVEALA